ncbi:MAG: hypothetical protein WBF71_16610 [Microthrixaceae bacterium]
MSRSTVLAVASFLLSVPVVVAWVFALFDIARRRDLRIERKVVYGAVLIFVVPATLFYLLSRPSTMVGHRSWMHAPRRSDDWRRTLVRQLERTEGAPPVTSPSEALDLLERVHRLR